MRQVAVIQSTVVKHLARVGGATDSAELLLVAFVEAAAVIWVRPPDDIGRSVLRAVVLVPMFVVWMQSENKGPDQTKIIESI